MIISYHSSAHIAPFYDWASALSNRLALPVFVHIHTPLCLLRQLALFDFEALIGRRRSYETLQSLVKACVKN